MLAVLVMLVQVVAGAVASFLVGMFWYSPAMFGRVWWKYQFPGKHFGETETNWWVLMHDRESSGAQRYGTNG